MRFEFTFEPHEETLARFFLFDEYIEFITFPMKNVKVLIFVCNWRALSYSVVHCDVCLFYRVSCSMFSLNISSVSPRLRGLLLMGMYLGVVWLIIQYVASQYDQMIIV